MVEDRRSGFMLLEVLVAAVVAVVLLTLLTRLAMDNQYRVAAVRGTSGAMAVARSVLEEASARKGLAAGELRGMAGAYRWVVVVEALGEVATTPKISGADQETDATVSDESKPTWALFRVDVAVVAPDGRSTTLVAHRLGRIGS